MKKDVVIVSQDGRFEELARFLHLRQAVAILPALARASGHPVFLYTHGLGHPALTAGELPRGCHFDFCFRNERDAQGTHGIVCRLPGL